MTTNRSTLGDRWAAAAPYLLSLLRIVAGFSFMLAGTMKVFAFPTGTPFPIKLGSQVGVGGILEVACGALLLLGLFSRPAAFLMAGQMAVAYFQFHLPKGFWPVVNGGVAAVLYCFIWLFISAAGPGPISVDAWRRKLAAGRAPEASVDVTGGRPAGQRV
jgi:putative oxidoreductase